MRMQERDDDDDDDNNVGVHFYSQAIFRARPTWYLMSKKKNHLCSEFLFFRGSSGSKNSQAETLEREESNLAIYY